MPTPAVSTARHQAETSQEEELRKPVDWLRSAVFAEEGSTFGIAAIEKELRARRLAARALSQLCTRVAEPPIAGWGRGKSRPTLEVVKPLVPALYPAARVAKRRLVAVDGKAEAGWSYEPSHEPPSDRYSHAYGNPIRYVDPNGREPLAASFVQFFNAFFNADFSKVEIVENAYKMQSRTARDKVFLSRGGTFQYQRRTGYAVQHLSHELTHVLQYRKLGTTVFLARYLAEYVINRASGQTHQEAHDNITAEVFP